ncbi:MAG: FMN-binding glutamate synthase family protein [Myxococcales bacterium]|nr:FMN-binding glutamate synthase family protein [Myxococcales bacterium]MCB9641519.1 FMN-binding glutamate synthase family protein [Myxococcales bacterium]
MRREFVITSIALIAAILLLSLWNRSFLHAFWVVGPLILLGYQNLLQTKHAVLRNFPLLGYGRYLLEMIRPEINQYFVESNTDGTPFSREQRSVVYQRAKRELDTVPFGTQHDVYAPGYEWINHSMVPKPVPKELPRILIGEETCKQPYRASVFNISAMSFGSLSKNAVMALNLGAKQGHFAHNTGEGGVSPHHLQGGDLIWQIGTGYFGACSQAGIFDLGRFKDNAARPEVKMIEIKLSQGAKPGHGGILPAEKLTPEIAKIRGVPLGQDVLSPPWHSAFSTPTELCTFIAQLREESGGKPVGIKLCLGKRREFLALCKAMLETGIHPDYIVVDGGEGGTGAAPLEFSNSIGCPLTDALIFVHNSLVGIALRDKIRVIASGKVVSGFDLARVIALGADAANSARAMMLSLGCIQARRCNSNHCPVGVATQNPNLVAGLVIDDKAIRVANYHHNTVHSMMEMLSATGMTSPDQLRPWHIMRRVSLNEISNYSDLYEYIAKGSLLQTNLPENFARAWQHASAHTFESLAERTVKAA